MRSKLSSESNQQKISDNNRKELGPRKKESKIVAIWADILRGEDDAAVIEK